MLVTTGPCGPLKGMLAVFLPGDTGLTQATRHSMLKLTLRVTVHAICCMKIRFIHSFNVENATKKGVIDTFFLFPNMYAGHKI